MMLEDALVLAPIIVTIVTDYHGEGLLLKFDLRPRNRAEPLGYWSQSEGERNLATYILALLVPKEVKADKGYVNCCVAYIYISGSGAEESNTLTGQALIEMSRDSELGVEPLISPGPKIKRAATLHCSRKVYIWLNRTHVVLYYVIGCHFYI